jgi:hypothetical protein
MTSRRFIDQDNPSRCCVIGIFDHASTDERCADRGEEFRRNGYLDGRGSVAAVGGAFHEEFVGKQRALERHDTGQGSIFDTGHTAQMAYNLAHQHRALLRLVVHVIPGVVGVR